ncbi:MAG: M24 family metallopeptidase [Candidatus Hodarchaeales archaeon]
MLTQQELSDLEEAGKVARAVLDRLSPKVKAGTPIGKLYDHIVKTINKNGADLAFPPNISVNQVAAHDTAAINDNRKLTPGSLVKIDIGANFNGMLSDTAKTFTIKGKKIHEKMMKAAEEALNEAIKIIKPGIWPGEVGMAVQRTISSYGFRPVANLTGHQIAKGNLHAGITIPNVKPDRTFSKKKIQEGMIIAIEPFSTSGKAGMVKNRGKALIYSSLGKQKTNIGQLLYQRFQLVPFSLRDASRHLKGQGIEITAKDLTNNLIRDRFRGYPPLAEESGGFVAQAEHTVYVTSNGAKIIT